MDNQGTFSLALAVVVVSFLIGWLILSSARGLYDLLKKQVCKKDGHDWSYQVEPLDRPGAVDGSVDPVPSRRVFLFCDRCGLQEFVDVALADIDFSSPVADDDAIGSGALDLLEHRIKSVAS